MSRSPLSSRRSAHASWLVAAVVVVAGGCSSTSSHTVAATPPSPVVPSSTTTAAPAAPTVALAASGSGRFLVDATGRSLYTFDKDAPGATTSSCSGACATRWPLLTVTGTPSAAPDVPGSLSTPFASGGGSAVAWQGKLLYYFSGDHAPGDTNGDGVGGTWHLAKPTADAGGSSMTVIGGY